MQEPAQLTPQHSGHLSLSLWGPVEGACLPLIPTPQHSALMFPTGPWFLKTMANTNTAEPPGASPPQEAGAQGSLSRGEGEGVRAAGGAARKAEGAGPDRRRYRSSTESQHSLTQKRIWGASHAPSSPQLWGTAVAPQAGQVPTTLTAKWNILWGHRSRGPIPKWAQCQTRAAEAYRRSAWGVTLKTAGPRAP
jgi:hypothetical protein